MERNLLTLFGITVFLLLISGCSQSEQFTIDGDRVYVDDENVYISVEPHTISNSGWVEATFESKVYSGDIDVVFGFPTESIRPKYVQLYSPHEIDQEYSYICEHEFNYTTEPNFFTCYNEENSTLIFEHSFLHGDIPSQTAYWNETYDVEWKDFSANWNSIDLEYDGKNKWWYIQGQHINADQEYRIRYYLEKTPSSYGKYDMAIKPSGETLQQAIDNGHLYVLDPWFVSGTNFGTDLWAYYGFDNYQGDFMVDNISAHNLEQSGTVDVRAGYLNNAVYFEGYTGGTGEYLNISGLGQISFDELTVCSWWELEYEISDSGRGIMADGTGSSSGMEYQHPGSGDVDKRGNARWGLTTTGGGVTAWGNATGTKLWPPSGVSPYHFVCFVYDGTEARIYVNGTLASEVAGNYPVTGNIVMDRLEFGKDIGLPTGDDHEFSGEIDETGIWNRSFTQAEINVLYDNYVAGYGYTGSQNHANGDFIKDVNYNITIDPTDTIYFNSSINCSFVGTMGVGNPFDASLNWSNATSVLETNSWVGLTNGTIVTDLFDVNQVYPNEINCIVNVHNTTDSETLAVGSPIVSYAPSVPTTLSPSNYSSSFDTNQTLTCSGSTDPEGETVSYNLSVNGTLIGVSPYNFGTDLEYNWSCKACDDNDQCSADVTYDFQPVRFNWCNETIAGPLINFTFKDEVTLNIVNGTVNSDWDLTMNGSTDEYQYVNTSQANNWQFCYNTTSDTLWHNILSDITFIYGGTNYESRTYSAEDITLNSSVLTTKVLYQIDSDVAALYNIYTTTTEGSPISGVALTIELSIGGTWTQIALGTTDAAGSSSFYLNPTSTYRISATKSGYPNFQESVVFGGQTDYTIIMGEVTYGEIIANSTIDGLSWSIRPNPGTLNLGTVYTFEFNISSNLDDLTGCNFTLENKSDGVIFDTITGCAAGDDEISTTFNMSSHTIIGNFYFTKDGNQTALAQRSWYYINQNYSGGTLTDFFNTSATLFQIDGGTQTERASAVMWAFFFLMMGVGIVSYFSGWELRNPFGMAIITIPPIYMLSVMGMLTVDLGLSAFVDKYMVLLVAVMWVSIFFVRAHKRGFA